MSKSYTKHTPHTDALDTLGSIISDKEARDAIHLAVENVVAYNILQPGAHVGFRLNGEASEAVEKKVGIVDPFLTEPVQTGQHFWLIVYPRQISSLRHVWEHPDFPPSQDMRGVQAVPSDKEISEEWLRNFCNKEHLNYSLVLAAATQHMAGYGSGEEWLIVTGSDAHGEIPAEFWDHIEHITGDECRPEDRAIYFSCSC